MNSPVPVSGSSTQGTAASPRRWWIWVVLVATAAALISAAWLLMRPDPRRSAPGALSPAPPAGIKPATPSAASSAQTSEAGSGSTVAAGAAGTTGPTAAGGRLGTDGTPGSNGRPGSDSTPGAGGGPGTTAAPAEPGSPKYPIERVLESESPPVDPATTSLDTRASDKAIAAALGELVGSKQLLRFMLPTDIVQRIVLTIDNLAGDSMSMQYRAVLATPGQFLVERRGGEPVIAPQNARRYDAFVSFASSLDARKLVALYKRFYPLFQKTYRSIGYPNGHFNDRVVHVIDDLLAAPAPAGALFLDQPRVLYEYAENSLERRSVGQRIMLRIGPEHAAKLKAKLREIRAALTREN